VPPPGLILDELLVLLGLELEDVLLLLLVLLMLKLWEREDEVERAL